MCSTTRAGRETRVETFRSRRYPAGGLRQPDFRGGAMSRRHRDLAVAAILFSLPAGALAQVGYGDAPPLPSGPPLPPPPAEPHKPTWVENGPAILPASAAVSGSSSFLSGDAAWPVTHAGSACNFDDPNPGMYLTPTSLQVLQGAY